MEAAERSFVVESNATGQFRRLIRGETGLLAEELISRYDGRPLVPTQVAAEVRRRREV